MATRQAEIESEAAIYAEGTSLSRDDLLRIWNRHVLECEIDGRERENCQTIFEQAITGRGEC